MLIAIGNLYFLLNAIFATIGFYSNNIKIVWVVHISFLFILFYYIIKYRLTNRILLSLSSPLGMSVICLLFYMFIKVLLYPITGESSNPENIAFMHFNSIIKYDLVFFFFGLISFVPLTKHRSPSHLLRNSLIISITILVIYTLWVASKVDYYVTNLISSANQLNLGQNYQHIGDNLICYFFGSTFLIQSLSISLRRKIILISIISCLLLIIASLIASNMLFFGILTYIIMYYAYMCFVKKVINIVFIIPLMITVILVYMLFYEFTVFPLYYGVDSLYSRLELIKTILIPQLEVNILFGDLGAEYIVGLREQWVHSLPLHMQTHYGLIGSILLFNILMINFISLKSASYNLIIISFIVLLFAFIAKNSEWRVLWFYFGLIISYFKFRKFIIYNINDGLVKVHPKIIC